MAMQKRSLAAIDSETYEKEKAYLLSRNTPRSRRDMGYLPTPEEIEEMKWEIRCENEERERPHNDEPMRGYNPRVYRLSLPKPAPR